MQRYLLKLKNDQFHIEYKKKKEMPGKQNRCTKCTLLLSAK